MTTVKSLYLVTYSPLAKIFQKRIELLDAKGKVKETITASDLIKDATHLTRKDKFNVTVRRSAGDIQFQTGKLKLITDPVLRAWLLGEDAAADNSETDYSGVVAIDLQLEEYGDLAAILSGADKPEADQKKRLKELEEDAMRRSNERVLRAVRRVHGNIKAQFKLNEENGKGRYTPSDTEFLCALVLKEEENRLTAERASTEAEFYRLMDMAPTDK